MTASADRALLRPVPRRVALGAIGAASAAALVGCRRCGDDAGALAAGDPLPTTDASAPIAPGAWAERRWPPTDALPDGEAAAVRLGEADDAPIVIALHGRGEARSLAAGARSYRDDYAIEKVEAKLLGGRIAADDLGGFVTPARLEALNASLAATPYRRPTLVTPYAPALRDRSTQGAAGFAAFVCGALDDHVTSITRRPASRERRGIDGISMGGRLALQVALLRPEAFATVGAMQPAIGVDETDAIAGAIAEARARSAFALRLVSSEDDPFLDAVRALASALERRAVPHRLIVTPGPHDYAWNRGPGAAELLLFHERVLRGSSPP